MGRKVIAIIAGLFAAGLVILVAELLGQELVVSQRGGQPTTAMLLFVAAGWLFGSFAAALVAQRIDHSRMPAPALFTGAILLGAAIFNLATLPHPVWFRVLGVLVFLPGTILGIFFGRRRPRTRGRRLHPKTG